MGCGLAPEHIDRSGFIDRVAEIEPEPAQSPLPSIEAAAKTPDGMRSGSLAAANAKLAAVTALAQKLWTRLAAAEAAPPDPAKVPGLMAPKTAEQVKRTRDKTRCEESSCGSAYLRDLHGGAVAKKRKRTAEETEAAAKRAELAARKAAVAAEAAGREFALWRHVAHEGPPAPGDTCACAEQPCAMAKMVRCGACFDIKRGVCRKAACQPVAPLALTYVEPAEPLALTNVAIGAE